VSALRYFCQTCPYVYNIRRTVRPARRPRTGCIRGRQSRPSPAAAAAHGSSNTPRHSPPRIPAPQIRRHAKLDPKKAHDIFDDDKMWDNAQKTSTSAWPPGLVHGAGEGCGLPCVKAKGQMP
jgi:hypothetical protein